MRCPRCNTIMKKTMHFEKDRQYAYNACPKCHTESRSKRLHLEEYDKKKTESSDNLEKYDKQDKPIVKTASKQTKSKFNPPVKQSNHKTNTTGKTQIKHNRQKH